MRFWIATLFLTLFVVSGASCHGKSDGDDSSPKGRVEFGPLRVGEPVPGFAGVSVEGHDFSSTTPSGAFHVYVIDDVLPPACLNEECGDAAHSVVKRGGVLKGGSDGKLAELFGIEMEQSAPDGLEMSVIVVADENAEIRRIFPGSGLEHVPEISQKL